MCFISWVALLLGVFQMTIRECGTEYFNITQAIKRPDKLGESVKKFRGSEFDMEMLQAHVNRLAKEWEIGRYCLQAPKAPARCKKRQGLDHPPRSSTDLFSSVNLALS